MKTIEWWPNLDSESQAWLIANNGDVIPPDMVDKIAAAGGVVTSGAWWLGEQGLGGVYLSDEAVDWIETAANGE